MTNFRSFREEQVIEDLSNVNMFIGPNAAGKSNVIEAFRYLQDMLRGQVKAFFEIVFDRSRGPNISVSLCFTLSSKERDRIINTLFQKAPISPDHVIKSPFLRILTYSVTVKQNGILEENIEISNIKSNGLLIIRRSATNIESVGLENKCKEISSLTNLHTGSAQRGKPQGEWSILQYQKLSQMENFLVGMIRKSILNFKFFTPTRQVATQMPSGEELALSPDGNNLTKFLNSVQSGNPRRFVSVVDEILQILPNLIEVLAPLRGQQATITVEEEGLTKPTPIEDVSFGLMQILILVVGIVTKANDSVIFIEEPELHLHATSQRRLFELIQREAKNKQFFLTTHSTIFTACTEHNSTYLFTKPQGATKVRKIQEPHELKMVKEALGHRNTDLFGDECVVFIEGDSEDTAFPIIADSMGYNFVTQGIRLVNVRGSGKAKKLGEYLRYLKDSGILAWVIADGNETVKEKLQEWQSLGYLEKGAWKVWKLEFEDCFSLEMVTKAVNEWLKEEGEKFQLAPEHLKKERKDGVSVVRTLKKVIHNNNLRDLDKPALAEKLANLLIEDMKKENREKTPIEKEIRDIVHSAAEGTVFRTIEI